MSGDQRELGASTAFAVAASLSKTSPALGLFLYYDERVDWPARTIKPKIIATPLGAFPFDDPTGT